MSDTSTRSWHVHKGVLGGVAAACMLASAGWAQPAQGLGNGPVTGGAGSQEERQRPEVTLDFKGGSVQEFVELLKSATKFPVNVMMSPETSRVRLGPIRLERCPIWTAVEALKWSTEDTDMSERIEVSPRDNTNQPMNFAIKMRAQQTGIPVPAGYPTPGGYVDSSRSDLVGTYSIAGIVTTPPSQKDSKTLTVEQVTQAMDAVLRLTLSGKQPPSILVHKESGLLVVQGNSEQLRLAKDVVGQLKEDVELSRRADQQIRIAEEKRREAAERLDARQVALEREFARIASESSQLADEFAKMKSVESPSIADTEKANAIQARIHQLRGESALVEREMRNLRIGLTSQGSSDDVSALRVEIAELKQELATLKEQRSKK